MSDKGLEVVTSRRMKKSTINENKPVVSESKTIEPSENKPTDIEGKDKGTSKIGNAIVDNFGDILSLANDLVEIKKMKVQSDAILAKMKEDRETLIAEAEAYAKKKNADTSSVVERMKIIQEMMKDFYQHNNSSMTGEDFSRVISEIVTQMGRLD